MKLKDLSRYAGIFDAILLLATLCSLLYWITGQGLFYSSSSPVMSPFTSISLLLMIGGRLTLKYSSTWPMTLSMGWMGFAIGGNLSSIMVQLLVPELLLKTMPAIVPTSIMTSIGLILFATYELLVIIRKTKRTPFILDDLLILLALVPGGISILGHALNNTSYISTGLDPRVGISVFEMCFMGAYAFIAIMYNQRLYLWRFLAKSRTNQLIFISLGLNQFVLPIFVGRNIYDNTPRDSIGVEVFVMFAGVLATLVFLVFSAYYDSISQKISENRK